MEAAASAKQPVLTPVPSPLGPAGESPTVQNLQLVADRILPRTKTVLVLGFIAGLLLSPKLWVSTRFYPLVPVVHGLPRIPYPLDYVCYGVLLLLLLAAAFAARPRTYILTFAAFIAAYSMWDQTRWQPWVYQYWLMLIAVGCFSWTPEDIRGRRDALNICRLIVICTYFYSGLQKINHRFVVEGFPWILNTIKIHFPGAQYIGYVAAGIEMSIALCLLTRRFRTLGVVNSLIMHVFILYSFGPLGRNWNSIVWPWNVVMIALVLLLFTRTDAPPADILWRNKFAYQKVALLLMGVLPALSPFGLWPSDLSSALYTGNLTQADILVNARARADLPPLVQRYAFPIPGVFDLRIQDWAFGELNVPPYAEIQSFTSVGRTVCGFTHNSPDVLLIGHEKNTLLGQGKEIRNTCFGTLVIQHP